MGKFFLAAASVALFVYALFDLIATPRHQVRGPVPKPLWFVIIVVPGLGPILWLVYGHRRTGSAGPRRNPGPRPPHGPDDDPDYLRGL